MENQLNIIGVLRHQILSSESDFRRAKLRLVFCHYLVTYIGLKPGQAFKIVKDDLYEGFFDSQDFTLEQKKQMQLVYNNYEGFYVGLNPPNLLPEINWLSNKTD